MKRKLGFSSDTAGDLKAAVYGISAVIVTMEPGWDRSALIALFLVVMAVISWLTVGNIPPDAADELMAEKELADVLRDGRDE
jgi:hypothetical protein